MLKDEIEKNQLKKKIQKSQPKLTDQTRYPSHETEITL